MKWFKRYTAAALLMVLVLTAAACSRSDRNTTDGNTTDGNTTQENNVNEGTDGTMDGTVEEPSDKNTVEDVTDGAGNALEDMGDGVMDGVDDVVDGAENAVDDITGQTKR